MAYEDRVSLYKELEEKRDRPLIVYITSFRENAPGQMASDVISEFARQVLSIPDEKKDVDLLIVSNGGDPTVAWRCITFLRERFESINVLLPYTAYSAATLMAMGADCIIMHPFANLGPVDPQIKMRTMDEGKPRVNTFGSEDLTNYLSFVKEDVGISDQSELQKSFAILANDVGSVPVGAAKRSSQLSLSLGEKLLKLHMKDEKEAQAIAESLSKSYFHHGYPVGRTEAKDIGLPVEDADEEVEALIWDIWLDFEEEMQCNEPFNPYELIFEDADLYQQLGPVTQVQLPHNLPSQLAQQAYQKIIQQIQAVTIEPLEYELFNAAVESVYMKIEYKTKGLINATRLPDMNIKLMVRPYSQKWTYSKNPDIVSSEDK